MWQKGKIVQNQYLTEENYNKANKKIKKISLVVFVTGLIVGSGLIIFGLIKSNEAERINEERAAAAAAEVEAKTAETKNRLSEIEVELAALNTKLEAKEQECDSIPMSSASWFEDSSKCSREASSIRTEITNLDLEQFTLDNTHHTVVYDKERPEIYVLFYVLGSFAILAGSGTALIIYLITKRRALRAYGIQSTMPVNQEAVKSYTPTVAEAAGQVAGSVAEGIAKGIKKGKNS